MNVHFKDPDCAAGTFHTVTPLTLAGHLIGRLKLTPAASLSHERAFAFFAYVKKPKSMLDAAVFCGVGFSKEKISPSGQTRPGFGAPRLHIYSTPTPPASASEHHDVWYCVSSWCFVPRVLPRGESRRIYPLTVWGVSAQMLRALYEAWGECGEDRWMECSGS